VINGFQHVSIVFYAAGVVFMGGTALFGEFLARGRIGDIDFTAGVEPEILG